MLFWFCFEKIFTQVVYVNLQVFEQIVDDIVIQIRLNHLNNVNDDSKKKLFRTYKKIFSFYLITKKQV